MYTSSYSRELRNIFDLLTKEISTYTEDVRLKYMMCCFSCSYFGSSKIMDRSIILIIFPEGHFVCLYAS